VNQSDDRLNRAAWIRKMLLDYEQALVRYAFGITGDLDIARDVVQDTFLKLCRANRAKVKDYMPAWLYRVCRNRAFDIRKKEGRMQPLHEEQLSRIPSQRHGPSAQAERKEIRLLVLGVLNELPIDQREACRLKFNDELTYREIGRVMGKSLGTVSSLLAAALNTMRKRLGAGLEPVREV